MAQSLISVSKQENGDKGKKGKQEAKEAAEREAKAAEEKKEQEFLLDAADETPSDGPTGSYPAEAQIF